MQVFSVHFHEIWSTFRLQKDQKSPVFHFFHVKILVSKTIKHLFLSVFCLKHRSGPSRYPKGTPWTSFKQFLVHFWSQKDQILVPFLSDLHFSCPQISIFGPQITQKVIISTFLKHIWTIDNPFDPVSIHFHVNSIQI